MLEVGSGDEDEDVDDVFAHETWDRGTTDVFDGEVGDFGEGEIEGELFFDFLEGGGPCFLVFVDPDLHHEEDSQGDACDPGVNYVQFLRAGEGMDFLE